MTERVKIREVGPRDGFQNEPETIATEQKVELIDALARTGLKRLEVTSFVRAVDLDVVARVGDHREALGSDGIGHAPRELGPARAAGEHDDVNRRGVRAVHSHSGSGSPVSRMPACTL